VPAAEQRALCVSIHDVAPATWADCLRLWQAVRAVADLPLTWLVVPRYHGDPAAPPEYEAALEQLLARGHELALHGYLHQDTGPAPRTPRQLFLRRVFTQAEGEFAALPVQQARRRLRLGQQWFAARGWPLHGFVPPAWLLGEGAWTALRETPLHYTTTLRRFYCLGTQAASVPALSLVYAARNGAGRFCSRLALDALLPLQAGQPLVRLSLHPRDARHPELLRHLQGLLASLLSGRQPLTKAAYAETVVSNLHVAGTGTLQQ
jgi:predicted deacetylase